MGTGAGAERERVAAETTVRCRKRAFGSDDGERSSITGLLFEAQALKDERRGVMEEGFLRIAGSEGRVEALSGSDVESFQ